MKFSIIMPSRLVPYPSSAKFLDKKIIRAINSVILQSFKDYELIVISDECYKTKEIVNRFTDDRIRLLECRHKALFDNTPRNTGIAEAKGDYIIYLDIDDFWGPDHLKIVNEGIKDNDWVYFNDYTFNGSTWIERACNIKSMGASGTSNICHARQLDMKWERPGYAHDFYFNQKLLKYPFFEKIATGQYFVCHVPGVYDV